MELKEMADTGVKVKNREEALEYQVICRAGGWFKHKEHDDMRGYTFAGVMAAWDSDCMFKGEQETTITLAQFKERNGIMKYQEGNILVKGSVERKVLGAHSNLFHMSVNGDFTTAGRDYTEQELDNVGYTLKTDEPEMVELTLEDVAKLKGIPVETLRIKD